jgi:glycosyltransferase involved in cell wall biosynthesis
LKKNILICAHELSPNQGSECAEGWNIVLNLSKLHNLYVIYASGSQKMPLSYRDAVYDYLQINNLGDHVKFINVNQPRTTIFLSKLNYLLNKENSAIGNPILYFIGYRLWQKKVYKLANKIVKENKIDLVHLLNSITFREPGYLWKLNLPYVWGPTGGLTSLPRSYIKNLNIFESFIENIRKIYINLEFKKKRIQKAILKADLIYTFSEYDNLRFKEAGASKVLNLLDAGTSFYDLPIRSCNNKIIVIWAGQLVKRKSLNILINSVSKLPNKLQEKFEFKIFGNGILQEYYINLIKNLNLSNLFIFEGKKNRNELFEIMKNSDLLVHTSYREATTNIIPEALSFNLPVVCHDISGMSIAINESCGYKIPLINEEYSSIQLTNFLIKIIEEENFLLELKIGAKKRSSEITWANIAYNISMEYNKILNK